MKYFIVGAGSSLALYMIFAGTATSGEGIKLLLGVVCWAMILAVVPFIILKCATFVFSRIYTRLTRISKSEKVVRLATEEAVK